MHSGLKNNDRKVLKIFKIENASVLSNSRNEI